MPEKETISQQSNIEKLTRKEALKKAGKYAVFTASAMITILVPKESQAASTTPDSMPAW